MLKFLFPQKVWQEITWTESEFLLPPPLPPKNCKFYIMVFFICRESMQRRNVSYRESSFFSAPFLQGYFEMKTQTLTKNNIAAEQKHPPSIDNPESW